MSAALCSLISASTNGPDDFKPEDGDDTRQRQIAEVVRRRGQKKFRDALIAAYDRKCVITGCDAIEALEAAYISPYRGEHSNHPQNGLLLRADLLSLFDLGLIAIDPISMKVVVSSQLIDTHYGDLEGHTISRPRGQTLGPSPGALKEHLKWSGIGFR